MTTDDRRQGQDCYDCGSKYSYKCGCCGAVFCGEHDNGHTEDQCPAPKYGDVMTELRRMFGEFTSCNAVASRAGNEHDRVYFQGKKDALEELGEWLKARYPRRRITVTTAITFDLEYVIGKLEAESVRYDEDGPWDCRWCGVAMGEGAAGHRGNCAVNVVKDIIQERDECATLAEQETP